MYVSEDVRIWSFGLAFGEGEIVNDQVSVLYFGHYLYVARNILK